MTKRNTTHPLHGMQGFLFKEATRQNAEVRRTNYANFRNQRIKKGKILLSFKGDDTFHRELKSNKTTMAPIKQLFFGLCGLKSSIFTLKPLCIICESLVASDPALLRVFRLCLQNSLKNRAYAVKQFLLINNASLMLIHCQPCFLRNGIQINLSPKTKLLVFTYTLPILSNSEK